MSGEDIGEAMAALREQSARLWKLADEIPTTDSALEARSIAARLDEVADRVEALLVDLEWADGE